MKFSLRVILGLLTTITLLPAADLPTISMEHLYYLRSRAQHLRKLNPDEMIDYCVAQKVGGRAFEDLYSQCFSMRIELTKLQRVEDVSDENARVKTLKKIYAAYYALLSEEAQRVQNGLVREGLVAADTLDSIGRDRAR
jgi:hypothetical protein